ncbi:hypothetical protein COLO4_38094 [Corchorus olitorius]|uniref:Uncharacterized protein n=1 Tax=Corchorus olitorius TaxID=93759 RepID=A0A1R3FX01_9ROSI|nr:hypothetical protein COLO4_38094 [Corchorus olitorius]
MGEDHPVKFFYVMNARLWAGEGDELCSSVKGAWLLRVFLVRILSGCGQVPDSLSSERIGVDGEKSLCVLWDKDQGEYAESMRAMSWRIRSGNSFQLNLRIGLGKLNGILCCFAYVCSVHVCH